MTKQFSEASKPDWSEMLSQALSMPGKLSEAYSVFHRYSTGNQILATCQLILRDMRISPIASFSKWKELGRSVKKGEKALELCMPVTVKRKSKEDGKEQSEPETFTVFALRKNWFSLDQTDGEEYKFEAKSPKWMKELALANLNIHLVPYEDTDGNCQGYANPSERTVAINPLALLPHKTMFHEMAHCLLHGGEGVMADSETLPTCIKEAEAESVAYICCATLELPGMVESRGYIQNWLGKQKFPDASARRVFSAADKILKAGSPPVTETNEA